MAFTVACDQCDSRRTRMEKVVPKPEPIVYTMSEFVEMEERGWVPLDEPPPIPLGMWQITCEDCGFSIQYLPHPRLEKTT